MARPRTYPDDLRDRLVAAALERLRDHTPEEVSLRDLAAECGTSTNAIYSIFGGKDGLIAAVVRAGRRELTDAILNIKEVDPGITALAAAGYLVRAWARKQPGLYKLLFSGAQAPGEATAISPDDLDRLTAMLEGLMDDGVLRQDDPLAVVTTFFVALHGFILLELDLWPDGGDEADRYFAALQFHLAAGVVTDEVLQAVTAAEEAAGVTSVATA